MIETPNDYFPLRRKRINDDGVLEMTVVLEYGPLHGERVEEVPVHAVSFHRRLDDGTVVSYRRWQDNVWRYDDQKIS